MPLEYMDDSPGSTSLKPEPHAIDDLINSYMEPEDCQNAVRQTFRIVELLLLSNRLDQANSLATAIYQHMNTILPKVEYKPASQALDYFWFTHPAYQSPDNAPQKGKIGDGSPEAQKREEIYRSQQWNGYRECTRTGWMLDHCGLPEPQNPHVWRETRHEHVIAMCARLLAKDKTPGQYPPDEQLREALDAAEKLYAMPQVHKSEWNYVEKRNQKVWRHSYLLYRRLVAETAIRVGRLDTAADVISQGLLLDGFELMDGASLDRFLLLPRIYEVLPLLAAKGKAGNPFFIEEQDAAEIVQQVSQTLERRANYGRQWSLAPERVGWRELLDRLAKAAWAVNSKEYVKNGVMSAAQILNEPAPEEDIVAAEARVGQLPDDLKEMYRIADGFKGGWHFLEGGLGSCDDIGPDQERNGDGLDAFLWGCGIQLPEELVDKAYDAGIVIDLSNGEECDGFSHLLVSPEWFRKIAHGQIDHKEGEYRYWNTSSWSGGDDFHTSVRDWVACHVERLERKVRDGEIEEHLSDEEV